MNFLMLKGLYNLQTLRVRRLLGFLFREWILAHCSFQTLLNQYLGPYKITYKITRKLNQHFTKISFLGVIAELSYCNAASPGIALILDDFTPYDLYPPPTAMLWHETPEFTFFSPCKPYSQYFPQRHPHVGKCRYK